MATDHEKNKGHFVEEIRVLKSKLAKLELVEVKASRTEQKEAIGCE